MQLIILVVVLAIVVSIFCWILTATQCATAAEIDAIPQWEVFEDEHFFRVRWSVPDSRGRYYWVAHYAKEAAGDRWAAVAAANTARRFNDDGKHPSTMPAFSEIFRRENQNGKA